MTAAAGLIAGGGAARRPARLTRRGWASAHGLHAVAALVSLLALSPFGFIVWATAQTGFATAVALVVRPRVGELLVNTALLELCTLPPTIVLAVALAWISERSRLPGADLWAWLAVAPLAAPAFVHSYAWISLFPSLHGLPAAALVSVLAYLPFLYLPVAAQMRRLDPALEDSAASLGHSPARVFARVVLPQLRVAICGGALLVALHLLGEFGLFAMLRFDTFTTAIVDQFQASWNGPAAVMLAGVLMLSCGGLLALEAWLRGGERYARLGSGAARPPEAAPTGAARLLWLALPIAVGALSLGVPAYAITSWLLAGASGGRGWAWAGAFGETSLYAGAGALATTVVALPMAWLSVRAPGRAQRLFEACHTYVGALPGVVVALGLVSFTVRLGPPLYQSVATVLMAYVVLFLPRALVALRAGVAQAPRELEQAASALGRGPVWTVLTVTLRLAFPGVAASLALVGIGVMTELTATLMLAPNGVRTLATEFWSLTSELDYAAAAPYAVLMVALSLPLTVLLHAQARPSARA